MGRDPIRAASAPIAGWATSRPAGAPNKAIPNCPGESSSRSWIAGNRAYQELNTAPCRKKVPVTDTRANPGPRHCRYQPAYQPIAAPRRLRLDTAPT